MIDKGMGKIKTNPPKLVCEVGVEFEVSGDEVPSVGRILDMLGAYTKTFPFKKLRVTKIMPLEIDGFTHGMDWREQK